MLRGANSGYLLDTHSFLWAAKCPERLGEQALSLIQDMNTRLYLSSISAFEIANKHRIGKLDPTYGSILDNYAFIAKKLDAKDLPLSLEHTLLAGAMEWEHRDPFDCLIVAQASLEKLVIITNDTKMQDCLLANTIW